MKTVIKLGILVLLLPFASFAQEEDDFPPLSYLRSDYKSVSVVAHVLVREAEISGRIGGYENWKIASEILESFKGKFRKGDVIVYFQGAEAGLKRELFNGEKIVFLLGEPNKEGKGIRYSVLENSTLPLTVDRVKKLRILRREHAKKRKGKAP